MKGCNKLRTVGTVLTIIITSMIFQVKSQNLPVSDQLETVSGNVEMHFIGHGSLLFIMGDITIYVDPVRSSGSYDNLPKADMILITHEHYDHLDADLINSLKKEKTVIICNAAAALKVPGSVNMKAGETWSEGNIVIEAVAAYNIVNERAPGQPFHPKGAGLGYTPEMKALKNIDIAFLPMNLPYTMTPEMVADAAMAFKPKILYPYHYGDTNTEEIVRLLKDSGIEVRIRNLK
jgi:L-ascorbate metabolism protein UlaG (beta-lactamase superfamily)